MMPVPRVLEILACPVCSHDRKQLRIDRTVRIFVVDPLLEKQG